LSMTM